MSDTYEQIRQVRLHEPERIGELARRRSTRPIARDDGRLLLIAADHPARGALRVGSDSTAMGDRYDLLDRLAIALSCPGVDGLLATPDIVEDLLIMGVLDDKVIAGSMNRAGLPGAVFELDDRVTAYTPGALSRSGLDFGKVLLRIDLQDPDTARTLETVGRLVSESAALQLPIMIEPFMSRRRNGVVVNELTADAMVQAVSIAAGLGDTSAYTWLKLPVVPDMEKVMAATTLPVLLLGGDPDSGADDIYRAWEDALVLPGVRGVVAGRRLLYPENGRVADAVATAAGIVHSATPAVAR
ncbi:deoxyribose-phosphate aldolase [Microbacterium protaetiae]|uniref:Deoxyribose-phosphate aldolase n=1 Tax=Microbacterium protaetiae TaxID=2509458 RepID=A0A4P6ECV9_9MICO|nr:deoxyribose-phosphate aldolase [Microbacterium protaetiae]QAY59193.1 deoxyribose-phosphate aldolase [Microbacterium protaetiae]